MEILEVLINTIFVIAGLGLGYILTYIAPEEVGPQRKYFQLGRYISIFLISVALLFDIFYFRQNNLLSMMLVAVFILYGSYIISAERKKYFQAHTLFMLMPFVLFASENIWVLFSLIIFAILEASLNVEIKKEKIVGFPKTAAKYLLVLIPLIILFII